MKTKLNIGCGTEILPDHVNLDKYKYEGVDVAWDLDKIPLPFKDEQFEEIKCHNILEHIDYLHLLPELARILKKGGKLDIIVPHFTSRSVYIDPTHRHSFSFLGFSFFVKQNRVQNELYNFRHFSKMRTYITFERRPIMFWNYFVEKFVNIDTTTRNLYERTPLRIFPAQNVKVILIK